MLHVACSSVLSVDSPYGLAFVNQNDATVGQN
jgi:hypothetical protein